MRRFTIIAIFGLLAGGLLLTDTAQAFEGFFAKRRAMKANWHQGYYQGQWGAPLALVVPPNVDFQTNYGNSVGTTQVTRIWPKFTQSYPGDATPGNAPKYKPVPNWPTSTQQLGTYYIRGPW